METVELCLLLSLSRSVVLLPLTDFYSLFAHLNLHELMRGDYFVNSR